MRTIRKRLICSLRSDSEATNEAINKVQNRYVAKMQAKGWHYYYSIGYQSGGNALFKYVRYITLYKPNLNCQSDLDFLAKAELDSVLAALESNYSVNGIEVMIRLATRGWKSSSYVKAGEIVSSLHYDCGYQGGYNFSRLVKVFT